jgi:hypothetical protein
MPNVLPTTLDTTQPGHSDMTICDGFALFQNLGAARTVTDLDDTQGSFFDTTINAEVFKITIASDHASFLGFCGPAYAIKGDTLAETDFTIPAQESDGATGTLVLGDHAIRGGFQAGLVLQVDFDINISLHFGFFHHTLLDVFALVYINLIQLILNELIELLTAGEGGGDSGDPNDIEMSSIDPNGPDIDEGQPSGEGAGGEGNRRAGQKFDGAGMVDATTNPFVPGAGGSTFNGPPSDVINPSLSYGFDILPLVIEASGLEPLAAVAKALENIGCGLELGPGISIGLPTRVTLKGATISNHPFDVTGGSVPSSGEATVELELTERTPVSPQLQPLTDPPDEIGFLLEHQVGISIGAYLFAELMFFKVIHIGAQTGELPLFYSVDTDPIGGPYENQLSFVPGGGPVPFAPPNIAVTITGYTANQPQEQWTNGILARYGVSYFNSDYESPLGPLTAFDPQKRFFAWPTMTNLPGPVPDAVGIRIYREFNDGTDPVRVAEILFADNITSFTDNVVTP